MTLPLLGEWVGEDGAVLLGEVKKAALAGGADNRSVGVKEVGAIVGEHRLADIFELTRAVQRRDLPLALRTLERLLAIEEPMRMLVLLTRDLRVAWAVRTLVERGQPPAEIARALRLPPAVGRAPGPGPPRRAPRGDARGVGGGGGAGKGGGRAWGGAARARPRLVARGVPRRPPPLVGCRGGTGAAPFTEPRHAVSAEG